MWPQSLRIAEIQDRGRRKGGNACGFCFMEQDLTLARSNDEQSLAAM